MDSNGDLMELDETPQASMEIPAPSPSPADSYQQGAPVTSTPTPTIIPGAATSRSTFKFKYVEAAPTPAGVDDAEWNKIYNAADSRMYNKHNKSATNSKKYRVSKETYSLALVMLQERRDKARRDASGSVGQSTARSTPNPSATPRVTQSRGDTPGTDRIATSISEHIKNEGRLRKATSAAPSSNRSTPAPSIAEPVAKMAPNKATKPARKKDNKKAPKSGARLNTTSGKTGDSTPRSKSTQANEDSGSDDGREYCLCRGPDDHRLMVYCEGGCDDWYHCECVGVDLHDAQHLLDRFVCPNCKTDKLFTTYIPMCRMYQFNGCRNPARVSAEYPSKYCSEEHKWAMLRAVFDTTLNQGEAASKGGKLNIYEASTLANSCSTKDGLDGLGNKPKLPRKPDDDPNRPAGLDYLTAEEQQTIDKYTARQQTLNASIARSRLQVQLLVLVESRQKVAAEKSGTPICGFDGRLSFNSDQFAEWKETNEGKTALSNKALGPRTQETMYIDGLVELHQDGPPVDLDADVADELKSMCRNHNVKKCRHYGWQDMLRTDFLTIIQHSKLEIAKLQRSIDAIIDDAETREATKDHDAHNKVIQYF